MPPHSLPVAVAGAGLLWVGWFGFNGGSALAANGTATMAVILRIWGRQRVRWRGCWWSGSSMESPVRWA